MTAQSDSRFMAMALALGTRGLGRVAPWPSVGCVIVKDGRVVGRGRSDRTRMQHAEPIALEQAGENARGATVYVTLEPCSHHGNTPPCADALVAAGVSRVVVALGDPNPLVNGRGIARLQAAGIEVLTGVMEAESRRSHQGFLTLQEHGRPFVTLKLAASLDGRIATATGESKWITSAVARRLVHAERARHDAVLVGAGTVRADNPDLGVRGLGIEEQPARVVMSRRLDIPFDCNLAKSARDRRTVILHGRDAQPEQISAWTGTGAELVEVALGHGRQLDVGSALSALGKGGITRIFCEGGGALAASLISADLVDELVVFNAGVALGAEGQPMLGALGVDRLAEAQRFALVRVDAVGPDTVSRWERSIAGKETGGG